MVHAQTNRVSTIDEHLQLLTIPQVAERLQISVSDVRRKIRAGTLPSVRLGTRQVRVRVSDLETYIEACCQPSRGTSQ